MKINPRSSWGAKAPKRAPHRIGKTPRLWLHHSVTGTANSASQIASMQRYHQGSRGWNDIAYSFLVDVSGVAWEGRGAFIAGGHTAGDNTRSHAICAIGNFDANQPPAAMVEAIAQLVAHGYRSGWWSTKTITGGHREAPGAATACPGRHLFALIPSINRRALALLDGKATPAPTPALTPAPKTSRPTVRRGSRGQAVSDLQRGLNTVAGAGLGVDGIFGSQTETAVRDFQAFFKLGTDGIVGDKTWAMLDYCLAVRTPKPAPTPTPKPAAKPARPTVRRGSRGQAVSDLQRGLNTVAGARLGVDGIFGVRTEAATKNFQRFFALAADGIVGAKTWAMLDYCVAIRRQ